MLDLRSIGEEEPKRSMLLDGFEKARDRLSESIGWIKGAARETPPRYRGGAASAGAPPLHPSKCRLLGRSRSSSHKRDLYATRYGDRGHRSVALAD